MKFHFLLSVPGLEGMTLENSVMELSRFEGKSMTSVGLPTSPGSACKTTVTHSAKARREGGKRARTNIAHAANPIAP